MKRNAWITAIVLLVVGIIGRIFADSASYVDANGLVHDSMWYPISGLLILISIVLFIILAVRAAIRYFRNR